MSTSYLRQRGLSLVELMISITLGLVLMAGVTQMFLSSKTVYSTQQNLSRIQETGRLAIDFLSRDIRMAGLYGCFRPNPLEAARRLQSSSLSIDGLHKNFGEFIRGYDSKSGLSAAELAYLGKDPNAATNIMTVRFATSQPKIINAKNTNTTIQVFSTQSVDTNGCTDNMCVGDAAVISDCFRARLFQVSGLSLSGTNLTISHADDWQVNSNITASFASGEVMRMNSATYFIAPGVSGEPSLWLKQNQNPVAEILEGIEKIEYKFATANNRVYRAPNSIALADWPNVTSVRVFVVARSMESNAVPEPQPYVVDGITITPVDRYLRQVFTATVSLRSPATNM